MVRQLVAIARAGAKSRGAEPIPTSRERLEKSCDIPPLPHGASADGGEPLPVLDRNGPVETGIRQELQPKLESGDQDNEPRSLLSLENFSGKEDLPGCPIDRFVQPSVRDQLPTEPGQLRGKDAERRA